MALNPYERITWRGVTANRRTIEMLEITELRSLPDLAPLRIPQGSYNAGGVSASGGTHDGGGVIDISIKGLTADQRDHVVWALRKTSFAAWYRPYLANVWPAHIHAVAIGDRELSPQAAWQVQEYKAGRNGLANQGPDNGPDVPITVYRQDVDMSYYGPEKWDDADFVRFAKKVGWFDDVSNLNTDPPGSIDAKTSLAYTHQHATDADDKATKALAGVVAIRTELETVETKLDTILDKLN